MRRAVPISILTSCALVLAACGGDDGGTADTGTPTTAAAAPTSTPAGSTTGAPTSSTASVTKPSVQIPAVPLSELKVTDLIEGSGTPAAAGDLVLVNYVGVRSKDGVQFDNSYDKGTPFPVSLGAGRVIKGWDQGLVGAKAGGRRQLDIPASLAYGAASQGDVIGPNEDLSFVIDVLAVVKTGTAADEPKVVVQGGPPVTELTTSELVPGSGATAELGQTAIINYVFPGSELDHIGGTIDALEAGGFEVHDVEGWREHYGRTCRLWTERLFANRAAAEAEVGAARTRLWLLYLAGVCLGFERGTIGIFQTVATKRARGASGMPPTRGDLYA